MIARTLLLALAALSPTAVVSTAVSTDMLPHNHLFVSLLQMMSPYISTTQLDRFLAQFRTTSSSSHSRRLQAAAAPFALPNITDSVSPEAYNGWIDTQEWRTFTSDIGRPGDRSAGDVTLSYVTARGSGTRGGIIVSVGHTEPVEKYAEQISDLLTQGFSPVYALDHRGQGRSSRMLPAEPFKSHVESRSDFVADFRKFINMATAEMTSRGEASGKRFLHCHSMGCAIAFTYLIEEFYHQQPTKFNAVAANAPLIKPVTDPFPYPIAVAIGNVMLLLGLHTAYPPTKGASFDEIYTIEDSRSDRQNIQYARCIARRDTPYAAGHAGLCLGDVTAQFASEFFGMFDAFSSFTKGSLATPILLQQARTNADGHDGIVVNGEQDAFCANQDSCTLTPYSRSAHNIWFETDSIRTPALSEVFAFYDTHAGAVARQNPLPPMCGWWQWWCMFEGCDCVWSCSHPAASC